MSTYQYQTVDVFTSKRFGGNPLAVFPDAGGMDTETMQALAAEMNYSETTFVLPPDNPANTARVRIFNRTAEMPFAGHPNVGTAYVLAQQDVGTKSMMRFEEIAGLVEVRCHGSNYAEIDAPQPLQLMEEHPVDGVAACLGVESSDIVTAQHQPVRASVGVDFVLVEVRPEALARAKPNLDSFRSHAAATAEIGPRLSIFLYHIEDNKVRCRMFAPLAGTWEDPATGSANATLAALRLSMREEHEIAYESIQGVQMGRRSQLSLRAWRAVDGIRSSAGGQCVSVFNGSISL